jgi:acetyl/propionyl-CoA carboxylase alpha subunit
MNYLVKIKNKTFDIVIDASDGQYVAIHKGRELSVKLQRIGSSNIYSFVINNDSFDFEINYQNNGYYVLHNGSIYHCKVADKKLAEIKGLLGVHDTIEKAIELRSPMPGLIVEIRVKEGDVVKAGQGIIVVEAMKMENELQVQHDCKVKSVRVKEREAVDQNQVLVEFE